jgi:hypothetical protein
LYALFVVVKSQTSLLTTTPCGLILNNSK